MNDLIAEIAVENTTYSFDRIFDYEIPNDLVNTVKSGCRVTIPFGGGNRLRQGMVMNVKQESKEGLKSIVSVLDSEPVLTEEMLKLVLFMKEHYFCTYYDAVKTMLPTGLNYNVTSTFTAVKGVHTDGLSTDELQIYNFVLSQKKPTKAEKI